MTYATPNPNHIPGVIVLKMSTMQAKWVLRALELRLPNVESSSENGHLKMTIEEIEEEFKKKKDLSKE